MKQILIFILFIFSITLTYSQSKPKPKFRDMERALNAFGNPVQNSTLLSDVNGKFQIKTMEQFLNALNLENESAVDSIYLSNDTLFIVYFNAPTLKYKASGLNGLFSASNNNGTIAVTNAKINSSSGLTLQTASGLATTKFNGFFNVPLQVTGQASEGYGVTLSSNTSNKCFVNFLSSSRTWNVGCTSGSFGIAYRTVSATPVFKIEDPAVGQTMTLKSNGDIALGSYGTTRTLSTNPQNFIWADVNHVLQESSIQSLIDTIKGQSNYSSIEKVWSQSKWINGKTIYWRTYNIEAGSNDYEFLTGLTTSYVDEFTDQQFHASVIGTDAIDFSPTQIEVDGFGNYQFYTSADERNIYLTVWYTKKP